MLISYGERVEVKSFSGLLVEFAKQEQSNVVIRGLRAISDYDYEAQMALMNRNLAPDFETIFLIAREKNSYISSSIVKEAALLGGDVLQFVPPLVHKTMMEKMATSVRK